MRTILYDRHIILGAKAIPFGDWEMPVSYKGIVVEHKTVREKVGLFDVSHMGRILIEGPDAESFLDFLSTNQVAGKKDGTATYTVWCNEQGGSVDDLMIYREAQDRFFVVVNASNREKDLQHLLLHTKKWNVSIQPLFEDQGILALQGPLAELLLSEFFPDIQAIKPMRFLIVSNNELMIARTGYTGAGGFELFASSAHIVNWWDRLLEEGQKMGIEPIGLGARDTLRLEMGFALYGHELSESIAPTESVSAWTVKWQKRDFLGKSSLEKLEKSLHKRNAYGIQLLDKGIAREGFSVYKERKRIGQVTSGSFSPTLNRAIALILVEGSLKEGDLVDVEIRQKQCQARVSQLPFVRKNS
jgi:aminomethyltransferase